MSSFDRLVGWTNSGDGGNMVLMSWDDLGLGLHGDWGDIDRGMVFSFLLL